jgi:hypothetical protein
MTDADAPNPKDTPITVRRLIDEALVMAANVIPALIYLFIYGLILSGAAVTTNILAAFVTALVIDLGSEYWVYSTSFKYNHDLIDTTARIHYLLTGASYIIALTGLFLFPDQLFTAYSAFLMLWLIGFLIGESLLVFLDDPFESSVQMD